MLTRGVFVCATRRPFGVQRIASSRFSLITTAILATCRHFFKSVHCTGEAQWLE
jgi:hypothetical protein